jgi:hypothetical protein
MASRIGGQQDEHIFVLFEGFLSLRSLFPPHSSVNAHERFRNDDRSELFT